MLKANRWKLNSVSWLLNSDRSQSLKADSKGFKNVKTKQNAMNGSFNQRSATCRLSAIAWRASIYLKGSATPRCRIFKIGIHTIFSDKLSHRRENIESRPIWPPARLRPVGDYAPEGRAYASERNPCTSNPYSRTVGCAVERWVRIFFDGDYVYPVRKPSYLWQGCPKKIFIHYWR